MLSIHKIMVRVNKKVDFPGRGVERVRTLIFTKARPIFGDSLGNERVFLWNQ